MLIATSRRRLNFPGLTFGDQAVEIDEERVGVVGAVGEEEAIGRVLAGAVVLCALACEPQVAALSTMQLLALSTLDGAKRDAIQQESFL